jgi:hypothetical protein
MTLLRSFPFVNSTEFLGACRSFLERVDAHGDIRNLGWTDVKLAEVRTDRNDFSILLSLH